MRLNAIQFGTSILAAQLLLSQAAAISKVEEEQKLRGSHGLKSQISKRALSETSNIESAQSSEAKVSDDAESQAYAFADDLFGLTWGDRDMSYVGGDEFIQMYDDGVETRIIIRGYMDINVQDGPVSTIQRENWKRLICFLTSFFCRHRAMERLFSSITTHYTTFI